LSDDEADAPESPESRRRSLQAMRMVWNREQQVGHTAIRRGAMVMISLPLAFVLSVAAVAGFGSLMPLAFGITYVVVGFAIGSSWIVSGAARSRRAHRSLRDLSGTAQLPPARVVKSPVR
jgi:Flp pilus assembly protein TadB